MGLIGLLEIALQCFDFLAWPLLALVYPLCCSVRAIENNSVPDTQKLNTYWVVFSVILLFEHAFLKLLEWFLLWPYIRITIVFCLVMRHFDGAFYVYKHFIYPCLSMDPQIVINLFNKQRKESFISENFLTEVERYVKENGPEALERIVGCEVSQAEPTKTATGNSKLAAEIKFKSIGVVADGEIMMTPPSMKVPKEWSPAISQVSTQSDTTFNSSLDSDQNLKAAYEALRINNQAEPELTQIGSSTFADMEAKVNHVEVVTGRKVAESTQNFQKEWTHTLCEVKIQSETTLNSHLEGTTHKAAYEALNAKKQEYVPKMAPAKSDKHEEPGNSIPSSGSRPKVMIYRKVQAQEPENSTPSSGSKPKVLCEVKIPSETTMNSHLEGRIHNAAYEALNAKKQVYVPKMAPAKSDMHEEPGDSIPSSGSKPKVIIFRKVQAQEPENSTPSSGPKPKVLINRKVQRQEPPEGVSSNELKREVNVNFVEKVQGQQRNPNEVPRMKDYRLWCNICSVHCAGEIDLVSHLRGRRHKENLQEQRNANSVLTKSPPLWCKICDVGCYTDFDMVTHLNGRRHQDCLSK